MQKSEYEGIRMQLTKYPKSLHDRTCLCGHGFLSFKEGMNRFGDQGTVLVPDMSPCPCPRCGYVDLGSPIMAHLRVILNEIVDWIERRFDCLYQFNCLSSTSGLIGRGNPRYYRTSI